MTKAVIAILLGGLIAGALDITYACLHYGLVYDIPPTRIFQSVAAGVFGRDEARAGGLSTASVGLGLHFLLTTIMAAFFVAWTRMVPALNRWPLLSGPTYGLAVFALMQFVVLPLSAAGDGNHPEGQFLLGGLLIHAFGVGYVIALIAKRFEPQQA
jgi:glucan phosphoethanolaminetransferase (alkaline phosphatase superfamily)